MLHVPPSLVSSASSPVLFARIVDRFNFLVAPDALAWTVYDVTSEFAPVQLHAGTVDLDADLVSTGTYAAAVTLGASAGRRRITWTATITSVAEDLSETTATSTWSMDFDVLAGITVPIGGSYVLVSDMREQRFTTTKYADELVLKRIREASLRFDRFTGRWFEPRAVESRIDGSGRPDMLLEHPIVGIESVSIFGEGGIDPISYRVSNDLYVPKLEFFATLTGLQGPYQSLAYPISANHLTARVWSRGTQNVTVSGVFGYLENGDTPEDVRRAVKLLAARELTGMASGSDRFDAQNRHRVTSERTREQSYTLSDGSRGTSSGMGGSTAYTGDPEIDVVIEQYARGPAFGAV